MEAGCARRCMAEAVWRLSVIEDVWSRQFEAVYLRRNSMVEAVWRLGVQGGVWLRLYGG